MRSISGLLSLTDEPWGSRAGWRESNQLCVRERECVCFRSLSRDIAERAWMSSRRGVGTPAAAMCVCVNVCEHSFMCITECSGYFSIYICVHVFMLPPGTCSHHLLRAFSSPSLCCYSRQSRLKKKKVSFPPPINKTLAVKAFTLRDCLYFL